MYRAPEVVRGGPYGRAIDAWSTGCILAECALRRPLFACDSPEELAAVRGVATASCSLELELDRVVFTDGGVLFAAFTVENSQRSSAEPAELRTSLREALPRSPEKQIAREPAMLHATLARLFDVPVGGADALDAAAERMTAQLCGLRAHVDNLWMVHEHDKLALATSGMVTRVALPFKQCRAMA